MAFISVIIPVYNCKTYLHQAIDSVLNQPAKDISIVLVDDGSTDGTAELCDQLAENNRVSVIHQKNLGVSAARNVGINFSLRDTVCKYIAFLDADDVWYPDVLTPELLEDMVENCKFDLYAFGAVLTDNSMNYFSKPAINKDAKLNGCDSVWMLQNRHFGAVLYSAYLLRKRKIRFPMGLKYNEDKIFLMQCSYMAETVHFIGKILHIYRMNPVSAMSKVKTYSAIDYYLPLIQAWVESDAKLNEFSNQYIHSGQTLAAIYFLDMAAEHFKQWRSANSLFSVLYSHPNLDLLINMHPEEVSLRQFKNRKLLLESPWLFALKYRLIGVMMIIARMLLRIPFVQKWRNKKRFPLTNLPNSNYWGAIE